MHIAILTTLLLLCAMTMATQDNSERRGQTEVVARSPPVRPAWFRAEVDR